MLADPAEYRRLDLRAHTLLADVPLHDVWTLDLDGGAAAQPMLALRRALSGEALTAASPVVRLLFGVRRLAGRLLALDDEVPGAAQESFLHRLSPADRDSSLVQPGILDGPFRVLHVAPREAISEVRNATVHAFSVFALVERSGGERLYWAIYVRPVGRITGLYMALIDPFRRRWVYPAILRRIGAAWAERAAGAAG